MSRKKYSAEFKAKVVLEVIRGDRELGDIADEYNLNPNMVRNWKKDFLKNASSVFDDKRQSKDVRRKEVALENEKSQMLKTIGQLTLERDFLQDCFRRSGHPIPRMDQDR